MSIERIALVGDDLLGLLHRGVSGTQVDRDLKNLAACVRDADLVIEALSEQPEHAPVKEHVLREIDALTRPDALVAMVRGPWLAEDFAELLTNPSRFVSLHVPTPGVVEVAGHRRSDPLRIEALWNFLASLGLTTLATADAPGGVVDRLAIPYFNEAVRLVSEGHSVVTVEGAARATFKTERGPFACMNAWGVARVDAVSAQLGQALGAFYGPPAGLESRTEPWGLTGPGTDEADAQTTRVIAERLWGVVLHVALDMISEHVTSPRDIDVGACATLGWARGPFAEMHALGPVETGRLATPVQARYRLWAPAALQTMVHATALNAKAPHIHT